MATPNAVIENAGTQAATARPTSSLEYIVSHIEQHRGLAASVAVLLLAAIGFSYWLYNSRALRLAPIESIAVMPFINASGNSDVESPNSTWMWPASRSFSAGGVAL